MWFTLQGSYVVRFEPVKRDTTSLVASTVFVFFLSLFVKSPSSCPYQTLSQDHVLGRNVCLQKPEILAFATPMYSDQASLGRER